MKFNICHKTKPKILRIRVYIDVKSWKIFLILKKGETENVRSTDVRPFSWPLTKKKRVESRRVSNVCCYYRILGRYSPPNTPLFLPIIFFKNDLIKITPYPMDIRPEPSINFIWVRTHLSKVPQEVSSLIPPPILRMRW